MAERGRLQLRQPEPGRGGDEHRVRAASSCPEKTRYASVDGHREDPGLEQQQRRGRRRAAGPTVTAEPRISTVVAAWPAQVSGRAHASASSGAASGASHGRAPRAAQPSASAQPGGTSSSATQVRTSAVVGIRTIATTTTAMLSGSTSAQAPVRKRCSRRGTPAAGRTTQAACAMVRTKLSREKNTRPRMVAGRRPRVTGPAAPPSIRPDDRSSRPAGGNSHDDSQRCLTAARPRRYPFRGAGSWGAGLSRG